jgi:de-etiolated-1
MLFEKFCDHFHVTSRNSVYMNFVSSHSNNIHALEQLRSIKDKASNSSQVKYCCWLQPCNCMLHSFVTLIKEKRKKRQCTWHANVSVWNLFVVLQFVKKMLASLPFSCQSQSPSPYFDQSLFRFDDKVYLTCLCSCLFSLQWSYYFS